MEKTIHTEADESGLNVTRTQLALIESRRRLAFAANKQLQAAGRINLAEYQVSSLVSGAFDAAVIELLIGIGVSQETIDTTFAKYIDVVTEQIEQQLLAAQAKQTKQ